MEGSRLLAVVESLFVFTLGSEVLFTIAVGFVAETFSEFLIAVSEFIRGALDGIRSAMENLGIETDGLEDRRR